jgi:hypothetical protein
VVGLAGWCSGLGRVAAAGLAGWLAGWHEGG